MSGNKFAEAKETFDFFVTNLEERAMERFYGIDDDNELDQRIIHQAGTLMGLGVSDGIINAIIDAASYCKEEDGGSSIHYWNTVLDFLKHRVMEEVKEAE